MSIPQDSANGDRFRNINPIHAALWVLLFSLLLMTYFRYSGRLPLNKINVGIFPQPTIQTPSLLKSSEPVLLASLDKRIYYHVPDKTAIFEHIPETYTTIKRIDFSPIISRLYSSSSPKRLAILASDDKLLYSIYLLDLPLPAKQSRLPEVVTQGSLPPGYSLRPESIIIWSPRNSHIAFTAYKDHRPDLFIGTLVNPTNKPQQLRVLGEDLKNIVWVDDQSIAFTVKIDGTTVKYLTKSNGADMMPLQDQN
jgi:hypothetical protein